MSPESFEPHPALGPVLAFFWVLLFDGTLTAMFALSVWRFVHYRGRTLRGDTYSRLPAPPALEAGPALLSGQVETDDGASAVRIEIDQIGTEKQHKNSWSHVWEEIDRSIQLRPFRLRLPNQEAVTVIPDERIRLVDDLHTESNDGVRRRRVAELSMREKVWVSGELVQEGQRGGASTAYRTGQASWTLRGTALSPLEVSSGSLNRQFAYWGSFFRWAAICFTVVWLAVHTFLVGPYCLLLFTGKVTTAQFSTTSTYITRGKNSTTTHYVLHARLPASAGGHEVKDEVSRRVYDFARAGGVGAVPFIHCPFLPSVHSIGRHADLSVARAIILMMISAMSTIWFLSAFRSARPWYEQRKVVERGSGRLAASVWKIQVAGAKGLFVDGTRKPGP